MRDFDASIRKGLPLERCFIKYGIGIVYMDKDLTRLDALKFFHHPTRFGLREMPHLKSSFLTDPRPFHLVMLPKGTVNKNTIGTLDGFSDMRFNFTQPRSVVDLLACGEVFDHDPDVISIMRIVPVRRVGGGLAFQ